jgi:hypothetical protein
MSAAREWIENEDNAERADRIARLEWVVAQYPVTNSGFVLHGGWLTVRLLEEAKYCFTYGQFAAAAALGVAFIERVLAAQFYGGGRNDLERASGQDLLREAVSCGWISREEFEKFDKVRRFRNPILHFRRPLAPDTHEHRAVVGQSHPDDIVQGDAQEILASAFQILRRYAI